MRLSHIAWNLAGLTLPLGVAVLTVPHLIEKLGQERFGLLALAWGLIGYAGALDLGIGRALTQMIGRLRGEDNLTSIPDALATAGRITLLVGLAAGLLVASSIFAEVDTWIGVKSTSATEVKGAILLLAIALPAQAMSATYRGVNEAFMNFKGISLLRAGLGAINFGGPFLISLFTIQLPWLVLTLVISRLLALFVFHRLALKCIENIKLDNQKPSYSNSIAKSLFSFAGWVTVSSIISPILVQADRFLIAATLSASAVTIYVLPYEVVVQSLILVGAISTVMFPGLSKLIQENPLQYWPYFKKWLFKVILMMAVVSSTLAYILPVVLPLWIKSNLKPESIMIGQILCIGVFANAIGSMFYALIHAKGRSDITAKIHIIELPIYIAALIYMLTEYGIEGAAGAWVLRMVVDASLLAFTGYRLTKSHHVD